MNVADRIAARTVRSTDPDGCWVYLSTYAQPSGHRQIWHYNGMRLVHRVAWTLANGPIPDGQCVLHHCDNPPCVRTAHLFLGTRADNNADRDAKGRHVPLPGEANGNAALTHQQVAAIRELVRRGMPQHLVAAAAGTCQSNVSLIHRGVAWASAAHLQEMTTP